MDIDYEDDRRRQARRVVFVRLLGARLRRLREARGWTRLQMVSVGELDIGMQTLATYEYGSREMPVGRLFQLAETLLVRPQDLIAPVCDRVSGWRAGDGPRPADGVTIDLRELAVEQRPILAPARRWARAWLRHTVNKHPSWPVYVELSSAAIASLAFVCGTDPTTVIAALRSPCPFPDSAHPHRGN